VVPVHPKGDELAVRKSIELHKMPRRRYLDD
jgi:hypothetical protein